VSSRFQDLRAWPYRAIWARDIAGDKGWVSSGIGLDTAGLAVRAVRCGLQTMGKRRYPNAGQLMIFAGGGGASNSLRMRLWKIERQALAGALGTEITVCHLPPGMSKWNTIKHGLVSLINQNWRRKLPNSYPTVILLIAATAIKAGLIVKGELGTAAQRQCRA